MSRALVTFGTGPCEHLARVSRPSHAGYAERHGYELQGEAPEVAGSAPPSWWKIPLLHRALEDFDEVLWLDADVMIADPSWDIADEVPADAWQALVRHHTPDGEVPNCGVWFVRPAMRPVLERLWAMPQYLDHPWWEQGALCELLGYAGRPQQLLEPTELYQRTHWLGLEWNSHEERDPHPTPRFAHATCGPLGWRLATMYRYADRVTVGERG